MILIALKIALKLDQFYTIIVDHFSTIFDSVEIIKKDFKDVLTTFKCHSNAILILDPPYLCTHQASYKQQNYFDLIDFLELIQLNRPPYLFFSSTKSEFIRFIDCMVKKKVDNWQIFDKAKIISINASTSYSGKYEDNMVFKLE